jgi:hypothetical protein
MKYEKMLNFIQKIIICEKCKISFNRKEFNLMNVTKFRLVIWKLKPIGY